MIRSLVKRARRAFDVFVDNNNEDVHPHIVRAQRDALASEQEDLPPDDRSDWDRVRAAVRDAQIARGAAVEDEYVQQFVTEDELTRLRRRCNEYFKIIETIEEERNQWIEMWRTQSGEHLTAQAMLERSLAATRQTAARAIMMLNKMRIAAEMEPIEKPDGLDPYDGEPVGLAEDYAARMLSFREKLGAPIDAKPARDIVDARTGQSVFTEPVDNAANRTRTPGSEVVGALTDEQRATAPAGRADTAAQTDS